MAAQQPPDLQATSRSTASSPAERAKANWHLTMPVLFLHAEYDYVCETVNSHLAKPMRAHCANLMEAVVRSGHWMAQEKPGETNALLAKWLATQLPTLWPLPDE